MLKTAHTVAYRDHWIQHSQGRIFARRWQPSAHAPQGSPIILLHDSLGCVALWRDFPEGLCQATGRVVIAYDRLGFGRSAARVGLPSLDFVAEEARDVFPQICADLGVENFVVLGHSVGGSMAMQCAATLANRCEALVTLAAQVFVEEQTRIGIRVAQAHFLQAEQMARLRKYHGDKARWVLDAWTQTWLHPDFASWSMRDVLAQVNCPVLAIHGAQDEYGSTQHPDCIAQSSQGVAHTEILADVGHMPHKEQAHAVLSLITQWLRTGNAKQS